MLLDTFQNSEEIDRLQAMTTNPQDAVLEYLTSIQQAFELDENMQQYGELLVSELMADERQVRFPARTAAACFLIASRLQETPIRVTRIADVAPATKSEILNEKKRISNTLELGIPNDDPIVILEDACKDRALPSDIRACAQQIADLGAEAGVASGVSPYTYAAAVLYIASSAADTDLSQADIADLFDVSTATLRDRRDDLLDAIGSRLFEHQYPTAPVEAISLVDDLLHHAQTAQWTQGKRQMGVLAGAWLRAANKYQVETSVSELTDLTSVSESTIRSRREDFVKYTETLDGSTTD